MKKNHVWRALLTICLAACFSVPALAAAQIGPAWVNGVSISELSQSNYYTGTMTPQDTATESAEKPVLVTARSGRKGKISTATTSAAATAAAAENESTAGGNAATSTMTTTSAGSAVATPTAGSATDPSTALLEKQAAEQAEAAALAAQIAQEEAAASIGTRTGETPIGECSPAVVGTNSFPTR